MGNTKIKPSHSVGEHIKSGNGTEYVVARIWEHEPHWDYELINTATGEYGALRELKSPTTKEA